MKLAEMPAFPSTFPCEHGGTFVYTGATMRMYFAGLAMASLANHYTQGGVFFEDLVAHGAVKLADALIAELEKESK